MGRLAALLIMLSLFGPPVALLLVSLGLIVLKKRSSLPAWIVRLTTPPFYLISLPIATLIVSAEMVGVYCLLLFANISWSFYFDHLFSSILSALLPFSLVLGHYASLRFGSFVGFWTAIFINGYLLWRTVWRREYHHQPSSRIAGRLLRALLLLLCFAWAYFYLVFYVAELVTPLGISDHH
jgi:hypothetical protein